ncbi:MAG: DUF342 domain-containing protein [Spirochaetales bacterium]|nr:DUF342 domain-containing protein [Spirochaetales bacterium]
MKESIQGNIDIRISEDEMIAYLDFTPSHVIVEWSDDYILDLLKKSGVVKGYKNFHFSRIYEKLKTCEDSKTFEIAHGVPATPGGKTIYKFKTNTLESSLEDLYYQLADKAGKPNVFEVLENFLLEVEPGQVQNVVLNHFYVSKNDFVGEIIIDCEPEKGFNVKGKELEPDNSESGSGVFYLSNDLEIKEKKIVAKKSGFIRLGKNWADIVPFEGHKMEVFPSDDFGEYYLNFIPGSSNAPIPVYEDIIEKFENINFPLEYIKEEKNIIGFIKKSISDQKPIKFSITKPRKAKYEIEINQSKTKAVLSLVKGAGQNDKLSLKNIGELIRESKIKGMNLDAIKKRILEFYKSSDLKLDYLILEGKSPTRGEPRRLKYQKEFVSVNKIGGIVERITQDIEAFYPSFKEFTKDQISSAIIVKKGFEFAILTDSQPGDDGIDIYGNKIKGIVGNDPIIKTFENISIKQNKYISEIDGILDLGEVDKEIHLRVREHKDMFVDISVAKDAMSASFTFHKPEGSGEKASLEFILAQIESAGIVKGIDQQIVEESFNKFINGEIITEVVFAKGKIPTDKKSSRIKFYNNKDGKVDFNLEIEKGTKVAKIFPSKDKSEDGFDVFGTVMESSGVASLNLDIGDFILEEKQEDDAILLVADINGELQVTENSVKIVDKKVLSGDVSNKTGSIKTLCSLVIKGSVNSSLYVVSGGNIKIMGTVQGALISAEKNIIVDQGVKGEGKAVLRAKEKIDVKFIENGNMMAVEDIHIRKAAMHTKIISNGKILLDKGNSKIVGGETYCKYGLYVDEIGSPSGGNCQVSFGQDYLVADKIKVYEEDIEKIQMDLLKIDQILQKPGVSFNQEKLAYIRKQKVFLMKKLEKKNMKLFLLREKFEEHATSEVVIRNKIYPGVVFESHGRKLEILDIEPPCRIVFNPNTGQIEKHR